LSCGSLHYAKHVAHAGGKQHSSIHALACISAVHPVRDIERKKVVTRENA
jgi:hypothetical protein